MEDFFCLHPCTGLASTLLPKWSYRKETRMNLSSKAAALLAACASVGDLSAAFAERVIEYNPGTGYAPGYNNPTAALGQPSRVTPGQWGGPVDPFNAPYLPEQVVSLGTGGLLTLEFSNPISNSGANPFGFDFIIFGNAGFVITDGDYSGGGITDGSLYGANPGSQTLVWVSLDGNDYYRLDPSRAPILDSYYPTDGAGDFHLPLDPSLRPADFNAKDLNGIRALYGGSAGGAAYDLSWAIDANGQAVFLDFATRVRLEVIDGVAEIDGIAVVPEPGTLALFVLGGLGLFIRRKRKQ
jgi:hypothetical protein